MILASDVSAAFTLGDAAIAALLGYGVVFLGLAVLMGVVYALGKYFTRKDRKLASTAEVIPQLVTHEAPKPLAPGSAGGVKLHGVDPKTAAMLMAIVADKMGKPLNELRFISIQEVE